MKFFSRLKNLWVLSEYNVSDNNAGTGASLVPNKDIKRHATIVDTSDYNPVLDDDVKTSERPSFD